jgi:5-methylcytosine-specific restriction endonuclease McrA
MASNPRRANGTRRDRLRRRVLAEEDTCGICGNAVDKSIAYPDPWSPTVDEILPVSLGGDPLDRANCRLAHFRCNVQRGNGTRPTPEAVKRVRIY